MAPLASTGTMAWLAAMAKMPGGEFRFDVAGWAWPCGKTVQYPACAVIVVRLTATALAPAAPGTTKVRASSGWKMPLVCRVSSTRSGLGSAWNRPAAAEPASA